MSHGNEEFRLLISGCCNREIILDYPDGPKVITKVPEAWRRKAEGQCKREIGRCDAGGFDDGGGSREPRNAGKL